MTDTDIHNYDYREAWLERRRATINDDLSNVFAGDNETFDESAVRVAEYLVALNADVRKLVSADGEDAVTTRVPDLTY